MKQKKTNVKCIFCKKKYRVKPYLIKTTKYCSNDCKYKHQKITMSGKNNSMYGKQTYGFTGKKHTIATKYKIAKNKYKPIIFKKEYMNMNEWYYILGAYLSDGNIIKRNRIDSYIFRIEVIDKEFILKVKKSIEKICDLKIKIKKYKRKEIRFKNAFYLINISRKDFSKKIKKYFPSKECLDNLKKIKKEEYILAFLNGFFDGDGTIDINGNGYIIQKGTLLLNILNSMCKKMNIKTTIHYCYKTNINKLYIPKRYNVFLKKISSITRKRIRIIV